MRTVVLLMALLSPGSVSAFECPFGVEGILLPIRWSAEESSSGTAVRVGVQNTFNKQIGMVDAGVWFVDHLGRIVGDTGAEIDPDLHISADGANITEVTSPVLERLRGAKFEDFTAHICTIAVLFEDGTKAEF